MGQVGESEAMGGSQDISKMIKIIEQSRQMATNNQSELLALQQNLQVSCTLYLFRIN